MRWDRLFDDLEAQLDAAADDEREAKVADLTRREFAATSLEGRLRGAVGCAVELTVAGVGRIAGELRSVGPGWLLLDVAGSLPAVVATQLVTTARDLPIASREEPRDGGVTPGLGHILRVLTRDRTTTSVVLVDGTVLTGTIDRVGTDYLDLAEHAIDEPRRPSSIRGVRTLELSKVAMLRPRLV